MVVLWINGPFGVGKTTTANFLREHDRSWRLFDPEWVGHMLRANLDDLDCVDFQDLPPWRALVPRVALEIASFTGDRLLIVQSVLDEEYWGELERGFAEFNHRVFHVLLDATVAGLRTRIVSDRVESGAQQWRLDHVKAYESARSWMTRKADLVIDTTGSPAANAASQILEALK